MRVQPGKRWEEDCKAGKAGLASRMESRGVEHERAEETRGMRRIADVLMGQTSDPKFPCSSFFKVQRKTTFCKMRGCFRHLVLNN